jgi:hypothetical protein
MRLEAVDPLLQPRLERLGVASDRIPVEVEAVVAVVVALRVGGVTRERLLHDGVDDETGMTVRFGSARITGLLDELLDDDDHALRRERRLLLTAEETPDLRVAARRRAARG